MRVKSKLITVAAIASAIISFFSLFAGGGAQFASAAASAYTNVMTDLTKDGSFNAADYPEKLRDYSLNVIQIAESAEGELFIYTYQPSGQQVDLIASSINISRQKNNSLEMSFPNYTLTFLNSNGVFYKYKVDGFELEEKEIRYYNISNILRPFSNMLDKLPAVGTISEVPNAVGQLWTVRTVGDSVEYAMTGSDVITVTKKYVGFFDYVDGITTSGAPGIYGEISAQHTQRNFVAFSTDRPIDRLIEVELQYGLADCSFEYCANPFHTGSSVDDPHAYKDYVSKTKGEPVTQEPVIISADEKDENALHGWFGNKYTWKKIQSTADFLKEQENNKEKYELTNSEGVDSIEGTQWVLNFYKETHVIHGNSNIADNHLFCEYQKVTDVILLRLMFETDGETYNLGVVDCKMTGDDKPLNGPKTPEGLPTWAIILIVIGVALVVLLVLAIVFPAFAAVLKAIFYIIGAPFRAIGRAIDRRKNNRPKPAKRKHTKGATSKHKHKTGKKKGGKK